MAANKARQDLKDKVELERTLLRQIRTLNKKIARDSVRKFGASGEVVNANDYRGELSDILLDHYKKVAKIFDSRIRGDLPEHLAITEEESSKIDEALGIYFLARSGEQSQIITETNQRDIGAATAEGIDDAQQQAIDTGNRLSGPEVAVLIGLGLTRKLNGRAGAIALFETQTSAEASKATEAEVLSGQEPSILAGDQKKSTTKKEWVTVGDEKVREAHMRADGQKRNLDESFEVGGEQLRWPGDNSLGATAGNIINCRCSSIYDEESVASTRQETADLMAIFNG